MGLGRLFDLPGAYAPGCILPPLRGWFLVLSLKATEPH